MTILINYAYTRGVWGYFHNGNFYTNRGGGEFLTSRMGIPGGPACQ